MGTDVRFEKSERELEERESPPGMPRTGEDLYRAIFENSGAAFMLIDEDMRIISANPGFEKITGYPRAEVEGKMLWSTLVHEPDAGLLRQYHILRREDPEAAPQTFECQMINRQGQIRDILLNVTLIPGATRSVAVCLDITEHKRAEQSLRASEQRFRTIFDGAATANIIIGEDTLIMLANANFEKLTGLSKEELEGRISWTDFVDEDDLERMKDYHDLRRNAPDDAPHTYEFRGKVRGEPRNFFMSVAMIPGTRESVASIIDVTQYKQALEALKINEERFRSLAQHMPDSVFEADATGRFTYVNQTALACFRYSREDFDKGISFLDVIIPEDRERAQASFQRLLQGEQLGLNEYTALRKDGATFPVLTHTTSIYRSGKVVGFRGFLVDITEKKAAVDQLLREQKMEAITHLAGGLAHDFNNLLMGILGNISLLLMESTDMPAYQQRLLSMENHVRRGAELTRQLLGFAGGRRTEVRTTNLERFINNCVEVFRHSKREITFHYTPLVDLPPVDIDRGQIEQALLNLFMHACQSMPGGGDIYLSLEKAWLDEEAVKPFGVRHGNFVKVTITDTGAGLDEDTRAHIFEPVHMAADGGRGMNFGLASVHGIIKGHGGFILVDSEKDIGTSFSFYLPVSLRSVTQEPAYLEQLQHGHETVLLIDDEDMIIEIGSRMLESLGYTVLSAPGGRQGLKIYDENKGGIDLVILDMIMPDLSGRETFEALQRQNPAVKVLLTSGNRADNRVKEILEAGCQHFMQKPFNLVELSKRMREILDK